MENDPINKLQKFEKKFGLKFNLPTWSNSQFQERLMRFGEEFKVLKLESCGDSKTETEVRKSLASDLVRKIEEIEQSDLNDDYIKKHINWLSKYYE